MEKQINVVEPNHYDYLTVCLENNMFDYMLEKTLISLFKCALRVEHYMACKRIKEIADDKKIKLD